MPRGESLCCTGGKRGEDGGADGVGWVGVSL